MVSRATGLRLDPTSGLPLYRQIVRGVRSRIAGGEWVAGFRLPPTRALADELGTHRNTVVRAFAELQARGLVETVVGRGTFVAPGAAVAEARAVRPMTPPASPGVDGPPLPWGSLLGRASDVEPLARFDRFSRVLATRAGRGEGLVDLSRMQPPPELLPLARFRRCMDHVLRSEGTAALGYAPREGLPRLREQLAGTLAASGVPCRADDLLVTTGSQQALDLVARALVDPGDALAVDRSTYSGALGVFAAAGARLVGVPSDGAGPDLEELERLARGAKALYLMPNGHNPTGETIGADRRRELVAWSRRAGVPLIADDYGADLELDDQPLPASLRALDSEVTHLGTFSKKLIPALRVGFVVAPPALRARLVRLKHTMDLGTSALLQHALAEFLERGYLGPHLRTVRAAYRERRDALVDALERHLPPGVATFRVPARGLVLWLELAPGLDADAVFSEALGHGVLVTPSSMHGVPGADLAPLASPRRQGLRLTFCHEPPGRLAEGVERLGRAFTDLLARVGPRRTPTPPTTVGLV